MLYARTPNETALRELFGDAKPGEGTPIAGSCLILLYESRQDCDLVLEGLGERDIAYLPPEWYLAETVARHQETNPHSSITAYLTSLLSSFPETVAIPIHYGEFFSLVRLGLFEPPPRDATFALLMRRRGVDDAAAAFLNETGMETVTLGALDDDVFTWLLDRSFTIPQQREVVRSYMDARRLNNLEMRLEQWRITPRAFYDRLLKRVALVDGNEQPDATHDADRRQRELKLVGWLQDRTVQMVQGWMHDGWPEPTPDGSMPIATGSPPEIRDEEPTKPKPDRRKPKATTAGKTPGEGKRESLVSDPFA